jgi:hypothetical protein
MRFAMNTPARAALAGAIVVVAAAGAAGPAASAPRHASGLHDARYCEIIELKGAPPDATATVWNTIGLNDCPAGRWKRFDAGALAQELGDSVVVLNGPRHFLMDSATGETGGVRSFHGLRMRKVATIPIRTAAELAQTPYTDRTIERRNTWRWTRGRLVHELVAPGGDTYVMQSYAQIRDPKLTIGKLRSLSSRLDLPAGWRYRTRRLRRDLVLTANGRATIVQDDLLNTYQLATTPRRRATRATRRVSITGMTRMVTATTPGTIEDRGTVTGTPFGRGTITVVGTLRDARLTGGFRLVYPRGSISGTISMPFTVSGNEIDFRGTARLTGGTGAFRGISSPELQARDHNTLDGQSGTLAVEGSATY